MRVAPVGLLLFASWTCAAQTWPAALPEAVGIDGHALESTMAELRSDPHPDLKGVVVIRHGKLVGEWYFNGDDRNTLHDIRSATKSITSILMGIAIDRRLVSSADESIAKYLPGLPQDGKQQIRIRDLLTMRSGLAADDDDPDSPGNEDRLDKSTDWMKSVFAVPMKTLPGQSYLYCSLNAFIAGAIVENASGLRLDRFAEKYLFGPLGIRNFKWRRVPVNRVVGQGNLWITTRAEAAVGELVLNHGRWKDRALVSQEWLAESVADRVAISTVDPYADFYGYMWYTKCYSRTTDPSACALQREPAGNVPVHFASGNGGNKIYVIPSADMVLAITSSAYHKGYGQRRSQDILLRLLAAATISK